MAWTTLFSYCTNILNLPSYDCVGLIHAYMHLFLLAGPYVQPVIIGHTYAL